MVTAFCRDTVSLEGVCCVKDASSVSSIPTPLMSWHGLPATQMCAISATLEVMRSIDDFQRDTNSTAMEFVTDLCNAKPEVHAKCQFIPTAII